MKRFLKSVRYLYVLNRRMYKRGIIVSAYDAMKNAWLWEVYDRIRYRIVYGVRE